MAERERIYVSPDGANWKVTCDHCGDLGRFWVKETAILAARQHVRSLVEGKLAQIMVQRENGTWQTEWTYGQDPYPPAG